MVIFDFEFLWASAAAHCTISVKDTVQSCENQVSAMYLLQSIFYVININTFEGGAKQVKDT